MPKYKIHPGQEQFLEQVGFKLEPRHPQGKAVYTKIENLRGTGIKISAAVQRDGTVMYLICNYLAKHPFSAPVVPISTPKEYAVRKANNDMAAKLQKDLESTIGCSNAFVGTIQPSFTSIYFESKEPSKGVYDRLYRLLASITGLLDQKQPISFPG